MANDFADLKSTLANARIARDNNALYQTILGLINGSQTTGESVTSIQTIIDALNAKLQNASVVTIVEVDTSVSPQTYALAAFVNGLTIFKDISGNASVNNITLTGTVEGTVDPVINTNYGLYRVFYGTDGFLYQW